MQTMTLRLPQKYSMFVCCSQSTNIIIFSPLFLSFFIIFRYELCDIIGRNKNLPFIFCSMVMRYPKFHWFSYLFFHVQMLYWLTSHTFCQQRWWYKPTTKKKEQLHTQRIRNRRQKRNFTPNHWMYWSQKTKKKIFLKLNHKKYCNRC